jgi:uncharacterized membrane protein
MCPDQRLFASRYNERPRMTTRSGFRNLGVHVYGIAAIALGVIGLIWRDFASVWQPIATDIPHYTALALLCAVVFLVAGFAVQWRPSADAGLVVLAVLYSIFAVRWLLRVVGFPSLIGTWLGFAEQFTLVLAAIVATSWLYRAASMSRAIRVLFGLCLVSFALAHFIAVKETAGMVPTWIPGSQHFWAIATGVAHLLAGIALITGVMARLAARLFTLMILCFGVLIWVPRLVGDPHNHMNWAGNAVNLAIAGAAWVFADSIAQRRGSGLKRHHAGA